MNQQLATLQNFLEQEHELPVVEVPEYGTGKFGKWEVSINTPALRLIRGYFNGVQHMTTDNYVLKNNETNTVWMSLTPLELESHAYHIEWAKGEVVVGGLGLGMYLYNIIKKPEVTQVWVVEQEIEIIQAFMHFAKPDNWEGWDKVNIINADIKNLTGNDKELCMSPDFLYVDIWPLVNDSNTLPDMEKICADIKPQASGWWCQEADYIHVIMEGKDEGCDIPPEGEIEHVEYILKRRGINLLGSTVPNYRELIRATAFNMLNM